MKVQGLGNQTAQEINPYEQFLPVPIEGFPGCSSTVGNPDWARWNSKNTPLPLIDQQGNTVIESGIVEVELIEQYRANDQTPYWQDGKTDDKRNETRQAYRIIPAERYSDKFLAASTYAQSCWDKRDPEKINEFDNCREDFLVGVTWQSNHPDPDKISRAKVAGLINEEIANQKEDQQLCTGMAHIVTNYAISLLTTILNQLNQL